MVVRVAEGEEGGEGGCGGGRHRVGRVGRALFLFGAQRHRRRLCSSTRAVGVERGFGLTNQVAQKPSSTGPHADRLGGRSE